MRSPFDTGNTRSKSAHLGILSSRQTVRESIGGTDSTDYFRFTLNTTQTVQLSLRPLNKDANLKVLNRQGRVLATSSHRDIISESMTRRFQAGTYYIRVASQGPTRTRYTLTLEPTTPPSRSDPSPPKDWTVMVYMAGNNLEKYGIQDFLEMARIGSGETVNIVAQFDRTRGYDSHYNDWTDTRRGAIQAGDTPTRAWGTSIGEANMGSAVTLKNFVNWSMSNYRASHYALILWGHGTGWDVSFDDISDDGISAKELSGALTNLPDSVDLVGTDACLMGTVEFAYSICDRASVFVGSQELEPAPGWNYTDILKDLKTTPKLTATQLGRRIVKHYGSHYSTYGLTNGTEETLSAIDLTALRQSNPYSLTNALNQFASTMMSAASQSDRTIVDQHRDTHADTFGDGNYPDHCDIGHLFSSLASDATLSSSIQAAAQSVTAVYSRAILSNFSSISGQSSGLSLSFTDDGIDPDRGYLSLPFAADTQWDDFLKRWAWW